MRQPDEDLALHGVQWLNRIRKRDDQRLQQRNEGLRPTPAPHGETFYRREEPKRDRHRRYTDDHRRVRPSTLQKMVKRYEGSGDPHDHVAAFRQAVRAEQVADTHTQIEGFGLTLEGKALMWFQTLGPESKESLNQLERDFIAAFSKMGIKHNAMAQIFSFQQKDHETVRDCVNRLKQYIARCPKEEKAQSSQADFNLSGGTKE